MAQVDFLSRPESQYIYWVPQKKDPLNPLEFPKWHGLFLPPIGANGYDTTYVGKTKNANLFEGLTYA